MTFFLTVAVYASLRWIVEDDARFGRRFWVAGLLAATAILAKPVALVEVAPIGAALLARRGLAGVLREPAVYAFCALMLLPYAAYDASVRSIAEWHWASRITTVHVLPELRAAFASPAALGAKFGAFWNALGMLQATMLGGPGFVALAICAIYPRSSLGKARTALYAWLLAGLAYAFVVVTVERVDYYLYLLLPLGAVWTGGLLARLVHGLTIDDTIDDIVDGTADPTEDAAEDPDDEFFDLIARFLGRAGQVIAAALAAFFIAFVVIAGEEAVADYYGYHKNVYVNARALDEALAPGALVVMGHYDPSVLYYINRKGWEEPPKVWTPFDEESAINKGARYFIAVEPGALKTNADLSHWLARFPLLDASAAWPVYETDPAKTLPGAEDRWKAYRAQVLSREHRAPGDVPSTPAPQ
jgi:hypothetical protein